MKTKRDKVDAIFSECVRERADWKCERCGRPFDSQSTGRRALHCSHLFSRRHAGTRWHPDGAAAHCFTCHQYLGENPVMFAEWITGHLGPELESTRQRAMRTTQIKKHEKEDIYKRLKAAYKKMTKKRQDGVTGRIEFPSPYEDDNA